MHKPIAARRRGGKERIRCGAVVGGTEMTAKKTVFRAAQKSLLNGEADNSV
jgi:hypothetical protein